MKCLRCGQCCKMHMVVIVDDPEKGIEEDNLKVRDGKEPCQHLNGDTLGEYSCAIHDYPWYKKTPCFMHGQIEQDSDDDCRLGRWYLDQEIENEQKISSK